MRLVNKLTIGFVLVLGTLMVTPAWGASRFPPPEFESGHELPTTTQPGPRSETLEYLDVAVLAAALLVGAYLSLRQRSRRGIFVLVVFSLVYFGFYREGCVCSIGAIQNITLGLFDATYAAPLTVVAFFLLPLIATLLFGRSFCGGVCPLGAIQDVVLVRPIKVPRWAEEALSVLAYAYLGSAVLFAATGSAFIICQYDPFVAFFRLSGKLSVLAIGVSLLVIGLFVGRPYCRFLCPFGVLLKWTSRLSKWRVTITPNECIECRLCEDACPFGAIDKPVETERPGKQRWPKARLTLLLLLLPVLMASGGWALSRADHTFARMHSRVRLAERIRAEETGLLSGTTDASDAFRTHGESPETLYAEAASLRANFRTGGWILGAFLGLVVGGKLIRLAVFRTRIGYQADRGRCISCGRCFAACPKEHERLKKLADRRNT